MHSEMKVITPHSEMRGQSRNEHHSERLPIIYHIEKMILHHSENEGYAVVI